MKLWHLISGIGIFSWPSSLITWDIIVLNGYLALNLLVPAYILYCQYNNRESDEKKYRPFVFLSIFWTFSIHLVTAFLYQGLPARAFWKNPLMGPRFSASAFAAGPDLITVVLVIVHTAATFKIEKETFNKLRLIIVISAIINLIMLFSEVFKEFYLPTHHSMPAIYLYFGLDGHNALVPLDLDRDCYECVGYPDHGYQPWEKQSQIPGSGLYSIIYRYLDRKRYWTDCTGLVPSPVGEVVDYAPSWVEVCVTLGIFAVTIDGENNRVFTFSGSILTLILITKVAKIHGSLHRTPRLYSFNINKNKILMILLIRYQIVNKSLHLC